jgi:putative Mn2+ efflux pump MntP
VGLLSIFIIAVALAMDAFAVSIASGIKLGCFTGRQTFRLSFHFGFFQFMMPVIGWLLGASMEMFIHAIDHWLALGLLGGIGGNMIYKSFSETEMKNIDYDMTRGLSLVSLSVATSIDALAVGITLGVLNEHIWYPSIIIGITAALFTLLGIKLGCRIGMKFSKNMEIISGIILIGLGVKIVLEHLFFSP